MFTLPSCHPAPNYASSSLPANVVGMGISAAELEIHPTIRRMDIPFGNLTWQRKTLHYIYIYIHTVNHLSECLYSFPLFFVARLC
jgi:hypothetical protein